MFVYKNFSLSVECTQIHIDKRALDPMTKFNSRSFTNLLF